METVLRPPSIIFDGRLWSSEELAAAAAGWLDFVREILPADAELTAIPLHNDPETIALFFALSALPLPVVAFPPDPRAWRTSPPAPPGTRIFLAPSLRSLAGAGDALGLPTVVVPSPRPLTATASPPPFLVAPGIVNFTSGSAGLPKPVYILTRSFVRQAEAIVEACRLSPGDAVAASTPLSTSFGIARGLFLPTVLGASPLGLLERFDHRALLRLFASHPYAYWAGTPLMADALARSALPGVSPRIPPICHIGTSRLSPRVWRDFLARYGVPLRPNYGQTENGFVSADMSRADEIRPGCSGRAAPGIEIRIGDDPLDPYPAGRPGRIWYTSARYMEGYGYPPRLAPREARGEWWPTQDVGSLDDDGYLTVAGRVDDCFKTASGYLVNPAAIVEALTSHPGVTEVVIMAVPGAAGSAIGAVVEGDAGVDVDRLRTLAARTLPRWLRPHTIAVTDRLPRLAGGKPDRLACRAVLDEVAQRRRGASV